MGTKQILEIGYKSYEKISEGLTDITPLMINLSEFTIFEKQKKFPKSLEVSKNQIDKLRTALKKGDKFPPIVIQIDNNNSFVTVVDGMHRIIAYSEENITKTNCLFVKRRGE